MVEIRGIDVSHHQGVVDWEKVAAAGIEFAIIRCGFGSNKGTPTIDRHFKANVQNALSVGLHIGTYLYSYALDAANARKEADFTLELIEPYRGRMKYPVAYDIEDSTQASLSNSVRSAMCEAFCDKVAAAGWQPAIYSSHNWITTKINKSTVAKYHLWLARFAKSHGYTAGDVHIWQHSEKGNVAGIKGHVDLNISYIDYAGGGAKPATSQPTVRRGDSGPAVWTLQNALNRLPAYSVIVDSVFGAQTDAAVRAFQRARGLVVDGIVGPKTWGKLEG